MKKKVGLITLLLTGGTAMALASCGNQAVENNSNEISALKTRIAALEQSVAATDKTLNETITAEINKLKAEIVATNAQTSASIAEAIDALSKAGTAKNNQTTATIQTNLNTLSSKVDSSITTINTNVSTLQTKVQTLETNGATKAEVAAAKAELEDALATKAALEAAKTEIDGKLADLEARMKQGSVTEEDLNAATTVLQNAIDAISAKIGTIGDNTTIGAEITSIKNTLSEMNTSIGNNAQAIVGIQTSINNLNTAVTTINQDLSKKVDTTTYQNAINAINATIGEIGDNTTVAAQLASIKNDIIGEQNKAALLTTRVETLEDKASKLGDEIEAISALVGKISEEDDSDADLFTRIYTIQAQIKALEGDNSDFLETLDSFYGDEIKDLKAGYVYELALVYAGFQNEMVDLKDQLIEAFGVDAPEVNALYNKMQKEFNYEMTGVLNKGIAYITLAKDEEEAEEAYNEYEAQLNTYGNETRFAIMKALNIKGVESKEYILETTQASILDAIEAVTYNSADIEDKTAEEKQAYYQERVATISLLSTKATNIDKMYKLLADTISELDTLTYIDNDETDTFIQNMKNAIVDETYMDAATKDAVEEVYKADGAELVIISLQAVKYNATLKTAADYCDDIDELLNTVEYADDIKGDINAIPVLGNYTALTTEAEIKAKEEADDAAITLIYNKAKAYDDAVKYAIDTNEDIADFDGIGEDLETIQDATLAVPAFNNYYALTSDADITAKLTADKAAIDFIEEKAEAYSAVKVSELESLAALDDLSLTPEQKTQFATLIEDVAKWANYASLETTEAVSSKKEADLTAIELYYSQAEAYSNLYDYAIAAALEVDAIENIQTEDKNVAKTAGAALVVYESYYDAIDTKAEVEAKLADDKAAIDFVKYQILQYSALVTYIANNTIHVNAIDLTIETEKTDTITAMNAFAVATNYVDDELTTVELVDAKLAEDKAGIDLAVLRIDKYAQLLNNIATDEAAIANPLVFTKLTIEEQNSIVLLFEAIPVWANYKNVELDTDGVNAQYTEDKAKVDLLFTQAKTYNTAKEYDATSENKVAGFTSISSDDVEAINHLITVVPVYDDYIKNEDYVANLATAEEKMDSYVDQAKIYNSALKYAADAKATISGYTVIDENERTAINNSIDGVVIYEAYIKNDNYEANLETAKTEIDLIAAQAEAYKDAITSANTATAAVSALTNVSGDQKTAFNEAINKLVKKTDYIENAEYAANLTAAQAAITLLKDQITTYDTALGYAAAQKLTVNGLTNIPSADKNDILDAIDETIDEEDYINNENCAANLVTAKAAMDLIVKQANAYSDAIKHATTQAGYVTALANLDADQKTYVNNYINTTPDLDNYLDNENYSTQLTSDNATVELYYAKAYGFNTIYGYLVAKQAIIDDYADETLSTGPLFAGLTEAQVEAVKQLMSDVVKFKTGYIDNETLTTATMIGGRVTTDQNAIDLIATKAKGYYDVVNNATTVFDNQVAELEKLTNTEKVAIKNLIGAVPSYSAYLENPALTSATEVESKVSQDKRSIQILGLQATTYNSIITYRDNKIDYVNNLANLTDAEKQDIVTLIYATFEYGTYINALTTADAIANQYNTDKAEIDAYVAQAEAYNEVKAYSITTLESFNSLTNYVLAGTDAEIYFTESIEAIPVYENYFPTVLDITTRKTTDKGALDLLLAQGTYYNNIVKELTDAKTYVDDMLDYIDAIESSTATGGKTNIKNLMDKVVDYDTYIAFTKITDVGAKYEADSTAIALLKTQAVAYDEVVKLAYEAYMNLPENITVEDEITAITDMYKAVPKYASYINVLETGDAITAKYNEDKAAIDLITYKVTKYSASITDMNTLLTSLNNTYTAEAYEDELAEVVDLVEDVPLYSNYFGDTVTTTTLVDTQYTADTTAYSLYKARMAKYKELYDYVAGKVAVVGALTHIYTPETIDDEDSTPMTKYLSLLNAYIDQENYDDAVEDLNETELGTYITNTKAAVDLIVVSAESLDRICEDLFAKVEEIDAYANLSNELKTAFIDRFLKYTTYTTHASMTINYTTATQFTTYESKTSILASTTTKIASYENMEVGYVNDAKATITAAKNNEKITEAYATYVTNVVNTIYATLTNVEVTSDTIAMTNANNVAAQVNVVTGSFNEINAVDSAITSLNNTINNFLLTKQTAFVASKENASVANTVFENHEAEINAKIAEVAYAYIIPEETTYTEFTAFLNDLLSPTQIANRSTDLENWYTTEILPVLDAEYEAAVQD